MSVYIFLFSSDVINYTAFILFSEFYYYCNTRGTMKKHISRDNMLSRIGLNYWKMLVFTYLMYYNVIM